MKKSLAILLAMMLLLSVSLSGCAKEPVETDPYADLAQTSVEEFELSIYEEYVTIRRFVGESKTIKIPAEIEGKPVTVIEDEAFKETDIEMLILPDSITDIRIRAFQDCHHLRVIRVSNSLKTIHHRAFMNCTSLEKIILPQTLTTIHSNAFALCKSLAEVQINGTDLYIGDSAFTGNSSLKTLSLNGVRYIGEFAFQRAGELEAVTIPETVKVIEDAAFAYCDKLATITFAGDLPASIHKNTFTSENLVPTLRHKEGAKGMDNVYLSAYNLEIYE